MLKQWIVTAAVLALCAAPAMALDGDVEMQFGFGVVTKIDGNSIVLLEYDFDADADIEITYVIDPTGMLDDSVALSDIRAGEEVEIEFVEKEGRRLAKRILKAEDIEDIELEDDFTQDKDVFDGAEGGEQDHEADRG